MVTAAVNAADYIAKVDFEGKAVRVDSSKRVLRDHHGRHVILHGVNSVVKMKPYIPTMDQFNADDSICEEDLQDLNNWGMQIMRLGVMWEAVEIAPGVYNQTYLAEINKLINSMGEKGIYTLVDAHQDAISRTTCGEGMPNFYARYILQQDDVYCFDPTLDFFLKPIYNLLGLCKTIKEAGYRHDEDGNPLIEDCQKKMFTLYYPNTDTLSIMRAVYYNRHGMQDKFVDYWKVTADALAGNPYVIGLDPFNEPFPAWLNLMFLIQHELPTFKGDSGSGFDKHVLTPMYARIHEKIKKADENAVMWFAATEFFNWLAFRIFDYQIMDYVGPIGFDVPPGGQIGSASHLFHAHSYCCVIGFDICDKTGDPKP